ncbi:MAG: potassium transporter Kup [Burkholderiaceae bacterium]
MSEGSRQGTAGLALAALGVVYGDIGTSPLYTIREIFGETGRVPLDAANVVGAVSVIVWALTAVVTLKYVLLILRADNRGEGGIMALVALAAQAAGGTPRRRATLLLVGVFGAALFYGDSVITPAISVLSAVEGLEVVTPALKPYVLALSTGILVGLFLVQRHGTAAVGRFFGPIMIVWFLTLAITGAVQIARTPAILEALNPLLALAFLQARGPAVLLAIGAIVLALTGAEALYADMGHFGKRPIRLAWLGCVFPALAVNYLGQGALLIADPKAVENPFFRLFPDALLIPAVILATVATVIASQAVISGAYSMTKQAIQLGFLPRMHVVYTSAREIGQIYVPFVNWVLLFAVTLATIGFASSSALASAYGIAVTLTMLITTSLTFFVVRHAWRMPLAVAAGATALFLALDSVLVAACALKLLQGGWFPILGGAAIFTVMATWKRGRELLVEHIRRNDPPLEPFIEALGGDALPVVPRTAVYLVSNADTVPQALLHNLKHNMVVHEKTIMLTVAFDEIPFVAPADRLEVREIAPKAWRVRVRYGFKDVPDIPEVLRACRPHGIDVDLFETSYFLSRETVVPTPGGAMARWREELFAALSRQAGSIVDFFRIPSNCVIELGTRIQI